MSHDTYWKSKQPARNDDSLFYSSSSPHPPSLHSITTSQSHRSRGSIILAASDALNTFKFRRRSKSVRHTPTPIKNAPIILPEVIEISAARVAEEDNQERLRLREAAAQSLGLGPTILQTESRDGYSPLDDDNDEISQESNPSQMGQQPDRSSLVPHSPTSQNEPSILPLTHSTTNSLTFSPTTSTSTSISSIPQFPSTPADLFQHIQKSSILLKFYPPPSIRIFSFNKQWKLRHIVLTSPPSARASYLHVFKATKKGNDQASKELELERLEINEDSVVFVAEALVGVRKGVIKVGGVDVGTLKKELNSSDDDRRTMWMLQIEDQRQAQGWIETIKSNILQLRSIRAGLGSLTHTFGGSEPKGDMDVMLSLRAQSLYVPPSPTTSVSPPATRDAWRPQTSTSLNSTSSASSYSYQSYKSSLPQGPSSRALKGLFGGRSRSPSGASLTESYPNGRAQNDTSFGTMGNNLMSMMKTANASASTFTSTNNTTANVTNGTPIRPPQILNRKITSAGRSPEAPTILNSSSRTSPSTTSTRSQEKVSRTLSLQIPLQPPPRKRWTSIGPEPPQDRITQDDLLSKPNSSFQMSLYRNAGGNGSLSAVGVTDSAASDRASALSTPRAPSVQSVSVSIQSVSTLASAERSSPVTGSGGRPSIETKRSSRRWSRQGSLPKRTSPPTGAPPAAPLISTTGPSSQSTSTLHPYANGAAPDNHAQSRSSLRSAISDRSVASGLANLAKQGSISGSSPQSPQSTSGASHLHPSSALSHGRPGFPCRLSMPPPRGPAPTIALPPAPSDTRTTRRDSEPPMPTKSLSSTSPAPMTTISRLKDRAFRRSPLEPGPPPSSGLPPRPDEAAPSSLLTSSNSEPLSSIPGSPIRPFVQPTFVFSQLKNSPSTSRHVSLKRRLRILSAPASAPNSPGTKPLLLTDDHPLRNSLQLQRKNNFSSSSPRPDTPIGEYIAHPKIQNDPSFITGTVLPTPSPTSSYYPLIDVSSGFKSLSTRPLPPPLTLPPPEPENSYPEFQSLSPPPRRTSKQLSHPLKEEAPLAQASQRDEGNDSLESRRLGVESSSPQDNSVDLISEERDDIEVVQTSVKHPSGLHQRIGA